MKQQMTLKTECFKDKERGTIEMDTILKQNLGWAKLTWTYVTNVNVVVALELLLLMLLLLIVVINVVAFEKLFF